ncbi:hypothetical protein AUR64_03180 [Haloprofundus marisrubri]|uniref:Uncharacterized protein n=1 Tax=Haloprofundus marisrubri TaxID=1514971 RepID=A0A0W1RDM4_9EURY|nr:hypothetical protein [Haloprofundus marisrubri]KTG11521.1 hypothetical protein AUR64_03180 [Haloprofundus marisrubri]
MSSDPETGVDETERRSLGSVQVLLERTALAVRGSLSRRAGKAVFASVAVIYFVLYSVGLRHLGVGDGSIEVVVVADPLARATEQIAPFQYESVAFVALGPVEYLFAPVNAAIGVGLAVLVGVNLSVSWMAWRGPSACHIGPGAGLTAGVPGILSGFVCCGPTVLLVVGVQASAGLVTLFQWLVPLAVVLLFGTLLWVGSRVDTTRDDPAVV